MGTCLLIICSIENEKFHLSRNKGYKDDFFLLFPSFISLTFSSYIFYCDALSNNKLYR